MNPDFLLSVLSALAGFLLKTTLGFGLCWVLARLLDSPHRRFLVWLGFLIVTAGYWLSLARCMASAAQPETSARLASALPIESPAHAWQVPDSWAIPLGLGLRGLGILYLVILAYMLHTHARRRWRLGWVLGFTTEPPAWVAETFQSVAGELHVRRSKLLLLSGAASPATIGWIWPKVLLPEFCLQEDRSGLEDVLRHELHHVRRWDSVWNALATASHALVFFHPAAWYALKKMQFERELACDLDVISGRPGRREGYAGCLVRFARLSLREQGGDWGIDFAASAQHLTVRVHSILETSKNVPRWLLCTRIAVGLALSAGFVAFSPSLAVLLSYAHQPMQPTLTQASPASSLRATAASRTAWRSRSHTLAALRRPAKELSGDSVPSPDTWSPEIDHSPRQTGPGPGPQLMRRGSAVERASPTTNQAQSIALVDSDGTAVKAQPRDHQQAVQQAATAAMGIYKRLAAIDRR